MDPLGQTVALLRPRALLWKQMQANGDWAVRFPANRSVVFCFVALGHCQIQIAGGMKRRLNEGDFTLLSRPPRWQVGRGRPSILVDYLPTHGAADAANLIGDACKAAEVKIVGGRFAFDSTNADLLDSLVPRRVDIRASDPASRRLRHILALIRDETLAGRPGQGLVVERLLEVLLVEAIRQSPDANKAREPGLLAGLADPRIAGALRVLHADVRKVWTVERVAKLAGMSRSAFAERFTTIVGLPPMDYLLRLRIALAKDALRFGGARLAEVAISSGYRSVSAFSTAFRRVVGVAPGRFARGN